MHSGAVDDGVGTCKTNTSRRRTTRIEYVVARIRPTGGKQKNRKTELHGTPSAGDWIFTRSCSFLFHFF